MSISETLANVDRLYIDAAPLIYYIEEEHPDYLTRMDALVAFVEENSIELFSSVITLTEVLIQPFRQNRVDLEQQYREILAKSGIVRLLDINQQIAEIAARLRVTYQLKTPDALHLATAINTGCDAFLTNDVALSKVKDIQIIILQTLQI